MKKFRSYFDKQAGLIHNNETNNSINPIVELSYGGNTNSASTKYSRFIFHVDFSNLNNKINELNLSSNDIVKHELNLKNVISFNSELVGGEYITAKRANGVDIVVFDVPEDFDEGSGFDYIYYPDTVKDKFLNKSSANWFVRKTPNTNWSEEGVYTGHSSAVTINQQRFPRGDENLKINITDYVNGIVFSGNTHNGLGIGYTSEIENITDEQLYTLTFFSRHTQTFFEPFVETTYNKQLNENRCNFYLDTNNKIYLNLTKEVDSIDKVNIKNYDDEIISAFTGNSIVKEENLLYYVSLNFSSDSFDDLVNYYDEWIFTYNNKTYTKRNYFTTKLIDFESDFGEYFDLYLNFSGLNYGEKISKSENPRKIVINPKALYKGRVIKNFKPDEIYYRVYVKHQDNELQIQDFTQTDFLNNKYFFEIDPRWLIPKRYYIKLKASHQGIEYNITNNLYFDIVSDPEI